MIVLKMLRGLRPTMLVFAVCGLATLGPGQRAGAEPQERSGATRWQRVKTASSGTPEAIGDYSGGCLRGGLALPLEGDGYQAMHPSRLRHFGHPDLLDFIAQLGKGARAAQLTDVLVADLSQPRGGRASGGHASHQSGLDVDIWYIGPEQPGALTSAKREQMRARSVLDGKRGSIRTRWAPRVASLLQLTAADARVERVFVHPIIKRELCALPGADRAWLGKLRPWYGHDDHFHVRLACPEGSPDCTPQAQVGSGDGCGDELAWWFSPEARQDREDGKKRYQSKVVGKPPVPPRCHEVIAQP
jgi:penicillin-insensitive murein endopeptidase